MASKSSSVWAIDIGSSSLKALHLSNETGVVEVIGFDNIQHGKILTGAGVTASERNELIALSLRQFAKQNDLGKDDVIVSVPSQNSFARFVNLPPVESKRIPEIVRFEAAQQIPFDIDDVQWDWQMMTKADSPERRVGIFAIKNDVVSAELEHFSGEDIIVRYVQMAPMALYNYVVYDRDDLLDKPDNQAIVVLNIGAENTDLVVCTNSTVWQRCIPMGGNTFTKAIADTFKLNFEKAEKLKRTASMSKYARQIFQAMRPVFADLATEVQRSLGFYTTSNPNTKLFKVITLGGGTNMRGLLKYLQQTLRMPIEKPDSFKKLAIRSSVSAAKFHDSVCDFGIVYGLALQGLGLAKIESNLLPRHIARSMAWVGKAKYFTVVAGMLLLISVLSLGRTLFDRVNYNDKNNIRLDVSNVIKVANEAEDELKAQENKASISKAIIQKALDPLMHRDVIPLLYQTIISALPNEKNNPEQKRLYNAFADGDVEAVTEISRKERKQIFVTSMSVYFASDIETAGFGGADFMKGGGGRKKGGGGVGRPAGGSAGEDEMDTMGGAGAGGFRTTSKYRPSTSAKKDKEAIATEGEAAEVKAGFVVTITGYSPYKDIGKLIDPYGVENDPNKWGFVTRLLHLNKIVDGNSPLELYKKTDIKHFKLETGVVDLNADMPVGVGIGELRFEKAKGEKDKSRTIAEPVKIDPMTKEIISKVAKLDESGKEKIDEKTGELVYEVNDHWFVLNVKFIWKNAPKNIGAP
jgi:type IV pilus assembly protein PilM